MRGLVWWWRGDSKESPRFFLVHCGRAFSSGGLRGSFRYVKLSELDFEYPEELVATERADESRIMLVDGAESPREISPCQLLEIFRPGDLWVVNETRVLKRRVFTAQGLEILFIRSLSADDQEWEVMCPSSRWKSGTIQTVGSVEFEIFERGRPQKLRASVPLQPDFFLEFGELALPPYIQKARGERHARTEDDREYQSIWARGPEASFENNEGSLAAPTASFHFDADFLTSLEKRGVGVAKVTLHVGLGTFLPVTVEDLGDHVMHAESAEISKATRARIEAVKKSGGRIVAVGTTVTRTLEAMALGHFQERPDGSLRGETSLLIRPGFQWRVVDVLLTNFHQPKSTLLALVAAFSTIEKVHLVYQWAIKNKFRLFSYGDLTAWLRP